MDCEADTVEKVDQGSLLLEGPCASLPRNSKWPLSLTASFRKDSPFSFTMSSMVTGLSEKIFGTHCQSTAPDRRTLNTHLEMVRNQMAILAARASHQNSSMMKSLLGYLVSSSCATFLAGECGSVGRSGSIESSRFQQVLKKASIGF